MMTRGLLRCSSHLHFVLGVFWAQMRHIRMYVHVYMIIYPGDRDWHAQLTEASYVAIQHVWTKKEVSERNLLMARGRSVGRIGMDVNERKVVLEY